MVATVAFPITNKSTAKLIFILLSLIACVSCKKEISPKPTSKEIQGVDVQHSYSNPNLKEKSESSLDPVEPTGKSDTLFIDSSGQFIFAVIDNKLNIINKANGTTQIVQIKEFFGGINIREDVNFDKIPDISYLNTVGSVNETRDYLIYNPKTGKFILDTLLSSLSNVTIKSSERFLTSFSRNGGGDYTENSYLFINGKPTLILSKNSMRVGDSVTLTHQKRINGEMKQVLYQTIYSDCNALNDGFDPSDYPKKKRTN